MIVRGRLAPSPTGVLHLGNARTFLLAWLDVRSRGGQLLLRVEDLDGPRVRPGAAEAVLEDLRWLGLDWDEGPLFQRPRLAVYQAALERLVAAGLAYPCVCSRRDVEQAASAPHAGEEGPVYPGTCRGRWPDAESARRDTGREPCWRFAVPEGLRLRFADRFQGTCDYAVHRDLGDFVLWKRDGMPAYQLAVVVDDAEQGISDVLRADDLLPSTARQILLYDALGMSPPRFTHTPLVVGRDGRRLAKRHGDTTLARFRAAGLTPGHVLSLLMEWSGLEAVGDPEALRPADLLEVFSLDRVPRRPAVWEPGLLPMEGDA